MSNRLFGQKTTEKVFIETAVRIPFGLGEVCALSPDLSCCSSFLNVQGENPVWQNETKDKLHGQNINT